MLLVVDNTHRQQLAWLEAIRGETGWNWSQLAKEAGLNHATFSRFRHDPGAVLETRTIEKIKAISPVPYGGAAEPVDDSEAARYEDDGDTLVEAAVAAMRNGSNTIEPWVLRSDALENVGYRFGDILLVDFSATPKPGDAVYAKIFGVAGQLPASAFRLYHKPFLVTSSLSLKHQAPQLIDDRVEVRGVVVASVRPRLSRLAS